MAQALGPFPAPGGAMVSEPQQMAPKERRRAGRGLAISKDRVGVSRVIRAVKRRKHFGMFMCLYKYIFGMFI